MPRKEGQFWVEDFFENVGGLNTADSPFAQPMNSCTGGKNFDYIKKGGFAKRRGHGKINSVADAQLKTYAMKLWDSSDGSRFALRAAGTKLQNFDQSAPAFTNLSEDTSSAGTDFLTSGTTVPVSAVMTNTSSVHTLWCAGGGMSDLYGAYSTAKVTKNGVPEVTVSAFTATATGAGGTGTLATGTYRYTLVFRKLSTQALGNASTSVEASATFTNGTHDSVDLAWTITNNDTTKYDKIYIYRSAVGGAAAFTAGALVTIVNSSATTYSDTGTSSSASETVPRANSLVIDNSDLPAGTYKGVCLFKRRLVTFSGSEVFISDVNKFESWPTVNRFVVPSGGEITAVGIISITTSTSSEIDELLAIFKENELWVFTGTDYTDSVLKFIDPSGCSGQALLVGANGYLAWAGRSGIYLWDGAGKPALISKPIEDQFALDGVVDLSKLSQGHGTYIRQRNEIIWTLSHKELGENRYALRLDLRLTLPAMSQTLGDRIAAGIFTPDLHPAAFYASGNFAPSASVDERVYFGDAAGFVYKGFESGNDAGADVEFTYETPFLTFGMPGKAKRLNKVVVWVEKLGTWNLTLDFWSDYRRIESQKSSISSPIAATSANNTSLWDIGYWDQMYWDDYDPELGSVTFNITSILNNGEGDAFKLRFTQSGINEPVTILGYQIYFTEIGVRK